MVEGKLKPSLWYYGLGCLVLLIGFAAAGFCAFSTVLGVGSELQQVVVPGEHELTLSEAGTYTVFHEYRSVVGDKVYSTASAGLPGLECALRSQETDEVIPVSQPSGSGGYTLGSKYGVAVLSFRIDRE